MWPSLLIRTCYWYFLGSAIRLRQEYHLWKNSDVSLLCTTEPAAIIIHRFYKRLLQKIRYCYFTEEVETESSEIQFWKSSRKAELGMGHESHCFPAMLPAWKNEPAYRFSVWIHLKWEVLKDKTDGGLYWNVSTQSKGKRGEEWMFLNLL